MLADALHAHRRGAARSTTDHECQSNSLSECPHLRRFSFAFSALIGTMQRPTGSPFPCCSRVPGWPWFPISSAVYIVQSPVPHCHEMATAPASGNWPPRGQSAPYLATPRNTAPLIFLVFSSDFGGSSPPFRILLCLSLASPLPRQPSAGTGIGNGTGKGSLTCGFTLHLFAEADQAAA